MSQDRKKTEQERRSRFETLAGAALVEELEEFVEYGANVGEIAAAKWALMDRADTVRVSPGLKRQARELAEILLAVAHSGWRYGKAPRRWVELANDAVFSLLSMDTRPRQRRFFWQWVLAQHMTVAAVMRPRGDDRVGSILKAVVDWSPDAPAAFEKPTKAQLDAAAEVLSKYRVARRGGGGGPLGTSLSSWEMARKFAAAFGANMPEKREVVRKRRNLDTKSTT